MSWDSFHRVQMPTNSLIRERKHPRACTFENTYGLDMMVKTCDTLHTNARTVYFGPCPDDHFASFLFAL